MTRAQQRATNQHIIEIVKNIQGTRRWRLPSYKAVVATLNNANLTTSRGNHWTPKRLFRMLQRNGIRGLHGLRTTTQT
jgi:hypothetical protein